MKQLIHYPFDKIGSDITPNMAEKLLIKFLMQNRCCHEYVDAWNYSHGERKRVLGEVVKQTVISICTTRDGKLREVFNSKAASFDWFSAKYVLNQKIRWDKLSDKWRVLTNNIYI